MKRLWLMVSLVLLCLPSVSLFAQSGGESTTGTFSLDIQNLTELVLDAQDDSRLSVAHAKEIIISVNTSDNNSNFEGNYALEFLHGYSEGNLTEYEFKKIDPNGNGLFAAQTIKISPETFFVNPNTGVPTGTIIHDPILGGPEERTITISNNAFDDLNARLYDIRNYDYRYTADSAMTGSSLKEARIQQRLKGEFVDSAAQELVYCPIKDPNYEMLFSDACQNNGTDDGSIGRATHGIFIEHANKPGMGVHYEIKNGQKLANTAEKVRIYGDHIFAQYQGETEEVAKDTQEAEVPDAPEGGGGGTGDEPPTCNVSGAGPLAWIVCPVITGALEGIQFLYNHFIQPQLQTDPLIVEDVENSSQANTYQTWSNIRNIANVLFVIAFLIIIFSQALGLNVDAYTIKKTLPRIIIAVVLVQISYFLAAFINDIANVLGIGIRNLIVSPAGDGPLFTLEDSNDAFMITGILAGVVAAAAAGLFAITPIILAGLFALVLGVLVLIARRVVLLALIIFSPIAMVAWVLPNTEKYAKQWFDVYIKVLLMFPIIAGLIGVGELLSATITGAGSASSNDVEFYEYIAALTVLFAPYFLLPFTFKLAGGVLGTITGMANDKGRGLIDRQRKVAQEKTAINRKAFGTGKVGQGLTGGRIMGKKVLPGNRKAQAALEARANQAAGMKSETAAFQALKNNDQAQALLSFSNTSLEARARVKKEQAKIDADTDLSMEQKNQKKASWDQAYGLASRVGFKDTTRRAAIQHLAGSGRNISAGKEGYEEISKAVAEMTGGTGTGDYANTMNQVQFNLKNAGRFDIGAPNNGTGFKFEDGWNKASLYQIANGKKETIQAAHTQILKHLKRGEPEKAARLYHELKGVHANATGEVANTIEKTVKGLTPEQRATVESYDAAKVGARTYREPRPEEREAAGGAPGGPEEHDE